MTGVVFHKIQRTAWHQVRHTYFVDVGTAIGTLIEVSKLFENCILAPPYPRTRYFKTGIDEVREGAKKIAVFQNIFPVRAKTETGLAIPEIPG